MSTASCSQMYFGGSMMKLVFTAVLAMGLCPSVCVCLCPSVTSRCSPKKEKRRITQTTPHDTPGTLVFWCQKYPQNSTGVTPYGGVKCKWGGSKSSTFDKYPAISRKRYKIDAWFLLKLNRKSYAIYRMVTLPMKLCAPNYPKPPHFMHFALPFIAS